MIKAFYSDPHFGHKNIIHLCQRPFHNVDHMTREMISRYNALIGVDDTVMWLGDCAFCKMHKFKEIMEKLNGRKILILGNHDRGVGSMADAGFDLVMEEGFMKIAGKTCRLKHYPFLSAEPPDCRKDDRYADRRPPRVKGEILIHGHTHSKKQVFENMVHVGVDAWDYGPAMMPDVEKLVAEL